MTMLTLIYIQATDVFLLEADPVGVLVNFNLHFQSDSSHRLFSKVQENPLNMAVFFYYLVQCTCVQKRTLDRSLFTRSQKNTACLTGHTVEAETLHASSSIRGNVNAILFYLGDIYSSRVSNHSI